MLWLELAAPLAVAIAWLILPGLAVVVCAGQRGFGAFSLSPVVSVSLVALAAVAGQLLGLRWTGLPVLGLTVVTCLMALGLRKLVDGVNPGQHVRAAWFSREDAWSWAGLAVGSALLARHVRNVFDRPDAFSQTFDNVFHLSAIRHIADTGRASSLTLMEINAGPGHSTFYPAAFHDLVSLVHPAATDSIPVSVTAVVAALAALVWPLACLSLVRSIMPVSPAAALGTGVLSASLPAFPVLLMDFGVLYPNLTGLALLPIVMGLAIQLFGLGSVQRVGWLDAVLLGLVAAPGLALGHPNVIPSLFLIVTPLLLARATRLVMAAQQHRVPLRTAVVQVATLLVALLVMAATWPIIRPPEEAATWPPPYSVPDALGQALLNAPTSPYAMWWPSALMVVGMGVAWTRGHRWLIGSWGLVTAFWLVIATPAFMSVRMDLTGNWYNDSMRYAAVFPHVCLPLALLGFTWLATAISDRLPQHLRSASAVAAAVLMATALIAGTQRASAMDHAVDKASANYQLPNAPLVDSDELALIERVPSLVGPEAVVATNPWNGSSMLYALTGTETTTRHILYTPTPEVDVINAALDEAGTKPGEVCPAIRSLGVTHVLDFGDREVHGAHHPHPGFDQLRGAPGFREVATVGHASLYEVTACR